MAAPIPPPRTSGFTTITKVPLYWAQYGPDDAVRLVKQASTSKFDGGIEAHLRLGVDPRHADQMVRGSVTLPHGTGKKRRVLVFATGEKAKAVRTFSTWAGLAIGFVVFAAIIVVHQFSTWEYLLPIADSVNLLVFAWFGYATLRADEQLPAPSRLEPSLV